MQRRLINALEDLKVNEDGTVRNTAETIIEFKYGEDGIDPTRSYQGAAVSLDEVVSQVLGRRVRTSEQRRPEGHLGAPPVTEEEMDLQAEAQLEEDAEEEETEEFGAPEEGPEFGGE
jgi:DNA-directed RNA polymerase subunit A'